MPLLPTSRQCPDHGYPRLASNAHPPGVCPTFLRRVSLTVVALLANALTAALLPDPLTAADTQIVSPYPLSFELPAGWRAIAEEQREALHSEVKSQYATMWEKYSGQQLHYFDQLPYLGAYASPDSSQLLTYSVMRFPPTRDYLSGIQQDWRAKADWGREQGYITSMTGPVVATIGKFQSFRASAKEPGGGEIFIATLFDKEKPYQAIQLQLHVDSTVKASGDRVLARALDTIAVNFDYDVTLRGATIRITDETQRFLFVAHVINGTAKHFLLIFQDPHWDSVAHSNLLSGISELLSSNEQLVGTSIVLTEGFRRGSPIDAWPLFVEDSECQSAMVRAALESFLVPGQVALGWCLGDLVPIFGSEEWPEYQRSADLWLREAFPEWKLSVVARNSAMARAVLDAAKEYINPMLIMGGMHLVGLDESEFSQAAAADPATAAKISNRGVADYLGDAGWGVVYLEPVSKEEALDNPADIARYRRVLRLRTEAQYEEYRMEMIRRSDSPIGGQSGVTTSPNVGQAAALVRSLKKQTGGSRDSNLASGDGVKFALRGLTDRLVGILRAALRGKRDFSLGSATRRIADLLGRAWVGPGARLASDGKTWISLDGLRQYRPPEHKKTGVREGQVVANFERRDRPDGEFPHNGHLAITDP
jgi:hypothetical protein